MPRKTVIGNYEADLTPVVEVVEVEPVTLTFEGVPFVTPLAKALSCEFIENEPGRNARRVPPRILNPTGDMKACPLAAQYRLKALGYTGTRSGHYCYDHVLAEIERSPMEVERLQRALARQVPVTVPQATIPARDESSIAEG